MIDKTQPARAVVLRQGEGAVVMAFVAIPVIWTSLVVPMIYCDICLRSLSFALGTAALVGIAAGVVREVVIGREDRYSSESKPCLLIGAMVANGKRQAWCDSTPSIRFRQSFARRVLGGS